MAKGKFKTVPVEVVADTRLNINDRVRSFMSLGTVVAIWERADPTNHPQFCEVLWDGDDGSSVEKISLLQRLDK